MVLSHEWRLTAGQLGFESQTHPCKLKVIIYQLQVPASPSLSWESQQTPELEEDRTPWCRRNHCWTLGTIPFWMKRRHSVPNVFPRIFCYCLFESRGWATMGPHPLKGVHFPLLGKQSVRVFCTETQKHRVCRSPSRRQGDVINCLSIVTINTYPCRHLITMTN